MAVGCKQRVWLVLLVWCLATPMAMAEDKKPAARAAAKKEPAKRPAARTKAPAKQPAARAKAPAKTAAKPAKPAKPAARTAAKPAARPVARAKAPAKAVAKPTARASAKPAARVAARPVAARASAKPAPAKPAARPVAAKPAAAKPTVKPATARTAAKPAVGTAKPAATAKPVARSAKPAARTAAKKPYPRSAAAAAAIVGQPIQIVTQTQYDMIFRGKKVGEYTRRERREKSGRIVVENKSRLTIKMLFAKVTAVNRSRCEYDKSGRLAKFVITSTVRGKTTNYTGTQDEKGITIRRMSNGKKSKPKFFAAAQYQGTSMDLRFPSAPSGVTFTRKYLIIPRMRVVSQTLRFRDAPAGKAFGKKQPLLEMTIRNRRGNGILLLTFDGRMVASKMRGMLGRVELRISKSK